MKEYIILSKTELLKVLFQFVDMVHITLKKCSPIIIFAYHTEYIQRNIASLVGTSEKLLSLII